MFNRMMYWFDFCFIVVLVSLFSFAMSVDEKQEFYDSIAVVLDDHETEEISNAYS